MPQRRVQKSFIERFADNFVPPAFRRNAIGSNIPTFNRGNSIWNRNTDFGDPVRVDDDQMYMGYLYAAISKRARRVSALSSEHLYTRDRANPDDEDVENHPYIKLIDESPTFANYYFWCAISTYLDLKGRAFIFALRNYTEGTNPKIGDVQEFKIINPFKVQRALSKAGEVGGWIEWGKNGSWRTIPVQQMIEIKNLNPFDLDEGFAMVDAAKNDQYLNQQTSAYTRAAIKNNVGQRGLVTTDVILEDEDFANFKAAVETNAGVSGAGKFLYGNGPGSLTYTDMQIDLEKLALTAINEVSREGLFAVAGVSKTVLGIEMSGVTRESGKVQSDNFDSNEAIPQLQTILDALNQDYRNSYKNETDYRDIEIYIDSPVRKDKDSEKADAEIISTKATAVATLVKAGFDPAAALEAVGLEDMDWFGIPSGAGTPLLTGENIKQNHAHHDHDVDTDANFLDDKLKPIILGKQTSFENTIVNIDRNILADVIDSYSKTTKNEITKSKREERTKELTEAIVLFMSSMVALFGAQTIKERLRDFGLTASFEMTPQIQRAIKTHARGAAKSHVNTILEQMYAVAKDAAEKGAGRDEIVRTLNQNFTESISKSRAQRIARTEANRSIGEAQYQADAQFLGQNGLTTKAYKRWITRSENPCPWCIQQEQVTASNPIPFNQPFLNIGDAVEATFENEDSTTQRTFVVGYEPIVSGTLHPNCSCIYELIIKT